MPPVSSDPSLQPTSATPPLHLAGELLAVVGKLRRKLREQGTLGDLTWSQKSALLHLEREGSATVTQLANALGMRSQSMGANIRALTKSGMVERHPDPADGRQSLISLTAQCREWIRAGRAAREDWLFHAITATLNAEEQETLQQATRLLERMVQT